MGEEGAERLLELGWRQGSLFEANQWVGLPEGGGEGDLLVVLTQSCSIMKAPVVEVAAARKVHKYQPRSREAAGRNFAKLQIPVQGDGFAAVEVSAFARAFHPTEVFLNFAPGPVQLDAVESRKLGGWMGRVYSRVALPNALVRILYETCLPCVMEAVSAPDGEGAFADKVLAVYIDYAPDDELGPFTVELTVLTTDDASRETIDRALCERFPFESDAINATLFVLSADVATVAEMENRVKFTDWDYLTSLEDEGRRAV